MNVQAIREGFASVIRSATNIERVHSHEPDSLNPPCVVVSLGDPFMDVNQAMSRGLAELQFVVRLIVSEAGSGGIERGMKVLDSWLSMGDDESASVLDALYENSALGGVVAEGALRIDPVSAPQEFPAGGLVYIAVDVPVTLYDVPR